MLVVWRSTGKQPPQLANQPPLPELVTYLWHWFLELRGSSPITFAEIDAWSRVTGKPVTGEEAKVLRTLDILSRNTK